MENHEMNVSQWVEDRLRALEPGPAWKPDATQALRELRRRGATGARHSLSGLRRGLAFGLASLTVAAVSLVVLPTRAVCAFGFCEQPDSVRNTSKAASKTAEPVLTNPVQPAPQQETPKVAGRNPAVADTSRKALAVTNYKELGQKSAPVACEVYADFECPACGSFYLQTFPRVVSEYVNTGKVRFVHRDFPLPQHPYARIAAKYANAAGLVGQYEPVVKQLFASQETWSKDGNVDRQVAQVLAPGAMQKVRELVANDYAGEASTELDIAMGKQDGLVQTPTMVIVVNGKRQVISPIPPFELLKQYLDQIVPLRN